MANPAKNLIGMRFNNLTVIERVGSRDTGWTKSALWLCRCDCGNTKELTTIVLTGLRTKSCGCARYPGNRTHGLSKSKTYKSWSAMLRRVQSPIDSHYASYGGRGIGVSDRWFNFDNFLMDMGERPEGKTLDRIDVNADYSPENCKWSTLQEQSRNTRRSRKLTIGGVTKNLCDWAEDIGITHSALAYRLAKFSPEEAINLPKYFNINK